MSYFTKVAITATMTCAISASTLAAPHIHDHAAATPIKPQTHAPIGVMGDHMHNAGDFMFSYRLMNMDMSGNLQGDKEISSDTIATSINNRFSGMPMMPATLRVVPQTMNTKMHMLGLMYAPTDNLTLMLMLNYLDKEMTLTTYEGMMGTTTRGNFNTETSGLADTKIGLLYRLYDSNTHHVHFNASLQLPTGDTKQTGNALRPDGMNMNMRLPYAMQLGSGSNIAEIGATYNGYENKSNWGAQVLYNTALEDNDEGYKVGNKFFFTTWYAHQLAESLSSSMRLSYTNKKAISGIDNDIMAPVQSADPDNYGGSYYDFSFGLNTVLANKHRVALEYTIPLEQKVKGVQMNMDNMLTVGYQLAF